MPLSQNYNPKKYENQIYQIWEENNLGNPETQTEKQKSQKSADKTKYLIFDCDGVLADSWEVIINARVYSGLAKDTEESIKYQIERHAKSPYQKRQKIDYKSLEKNHFWHEKEWEFIQKYGGYKAFAGFISEIEKITNAKMAVVSSNGNKIIEDFITKINLKFSHVLGFGDSPSKEDKVESICQDWGVDPSEVLFFTDTKSDVLELREYLSPENIFGTDWGWQGRKMTELLKKYEPNFEGIDSVLPIEQILFEFTDIHKVIDKDQQNQTHCILMPPPNLTGVMHAGHSFQHFLMDTLSRVNRQNGLTNLWYPGVDHAGIQLEGVIDKLIKKGEFDEELKKY